MILRSLAGALALACILAQPADARHRPGHVRHDSPRPIACRIIGAGGQFVIPQTCAARFDKLRQINRNVLRHAMARYKGRWRVRHQAYVGRARIENNESGVSWRGGYARVCVGGHCGTVNANLAEKFRGLFAEFVALGYNIGSPGCLSSGHMRHSLHHSGSACDLFNQVARNRTALHQPPPSVQIEVASRHGLTSGCVWRSPDCGHFDVSGIGGGRYYARSHHGRRRFASN